MFDQYNQSYKNWLKILWNGKYFKNIHQFGDDVVKMCVVNLNYHVDQFD